MRILLASIVQHNLLDVHGNCEIQSARSNIRQHRTAPYIRCSTSQTATAHSRDSHLLSDWLSTSNILQHCWDIPARSKLFYNIVQQRSASVHAVKFLSADIIRQKVGHVRQQKSPRVDGASVAEKSWTLRLRNA